jgi:hypothetical protein
MSLTSLQFEKFIGGSVLNSAGPGGFSTFGAGSLTPKLRGVQCTGDSDARGHSGDPVGLFQAVFDLTASPGTQTIGAGVGGVAEGLFLICNPHTVDGGTSNGNNRPLIQLQGSYSSGNQGLADCGIITDATTTGLAGVNFFAPNFASNNFGTPIAVPTYPFYVWLRVCWYGGGSATELRQAFYRLPGSSSTAWTALTPANNSTGGGAGWNKVFFENRYNSNASGLRMRLAAAQLYKCTSTADWTAASLSAPDPTVPFPVQTYTIDYLAGSDSNNGIDAPWKTHAKLTTESTAMGLIPVAFPNSGNGDTVKIINDFYAETIGNTEVNLDTDGLFYTTSAGLNAEAFKPYTTIAPNSGSWTAVTSDGASHTLSHTYSYSGDPHSTIREQLSQCPYVDSGTALSSTSRNNPSLTVGQYIDATPGSCWNNNSTGVTYYHPCGSTNPTSDGKIYYLSRALPGGGGSANNGFLNVTAAGVRISGVKLQFGMCDSTQQNNFVIFNAGCGSTCQIDNCQFLYADTHALTFSMPAGGSGGVQTQTGNYPNCTLNVINVNTEQALYESLDDNTALLGCYMGTGSAGSVVNFIGCTTNSAWAVQGSSAGIGYLNGGKNSVIHGSGNGCWNAVTFTNCNFGGYIQTKDSVAAMTVTGTTCYAIDTNSYGALIANACWMTDTPYCTGQNSVLLENCIFAMNASSNGGAAYGALTGAVTIQGCTFDCTKAVAPYGAALFANYSSGMTSFTFENNVILTSPAYSIPVAYGLLASTNPVVNFNEVQAANSSFEWMASYNGGGNETFAQWQALGFDPGSAVVSLIPLNAATYRRTGPSTVTHSIGPLADFGQEVIFAARKTPGAYEYVPPTGLGPPAGSIALSVGTFPTSGGVTLNYGNFRS